MSFFLIDEEHAFFYWGFFSAIQETLPIKRFTRIMDAADKTSSEGRFHVVHSIVVGDGSVRDRVMGTPESRPDIPELASLYSELESISDNEWEIIGEKLEMT